MSSDKRAYAMVTLAYWGFTLTDGALRMLVLLYFHELGYSPLEIATLFLLYELFGMFTNLVGGWVGSRLGLKVTLYAGMTLQVAALGALGVFDPTWPTGVAVAYVMGTQALSGIAKDLTKMSSKSSVKLLVSETDQGSALFAWVAALTGSKNALKGVGFFLGGVLLTALGFTGALFAMAGGLAVILVLTLFFVPGDLGQTKAKVKFTQIFSKSRNINVLSGARFFLFGSRDIWFVVGLPLFLTTALGWSHSEVGGYMAAWVIGYGIIQAAAPKLLRTQNVPNGATSRLWLALLTATTAGIGGLLLLPNAPTGPVVSLGLIIYGVLFAINSAVHSFLILDYTEGDKVTLNVGFYYMANAGGRLVGTILSGWAYQAGDLTLCLGLSAAFLLGAWTVSLNLPKRAAAPE